MSVERVERVDAATRIGDVHPSVHDDWCRLIADTVDHTGLEEPSRDERGDFGGVDPVHRRKPSTGQVEVVQRPVHIRGRIGLRSEERNGGWRSSHCEKDCGQRDVSRKHHSLLVRVWYLDEPLMPSPTTDGVEKARQGSVEE